MALLSEMDPNKAKAFDFAQDLTKLLITLATGIVTITITFSNNIADVSSHAHFLIAVAWLLYLFSILGGVMALMGMTAALNEKNSPAIDAGEIAWPARAQFILFGIAVALTIWFGIEVL